MRLFRWPKIETTERKCFKRAVGTCVELSLLWVRSVRFVSWWRSSGVVVVEGGGAWVTLGKSGRPGAADAALVFPWIHDSFIQLVVATIQQQIMKSSFGRGSKVLIPSVLCDINLNCFHLIRCCQGSTKNKQDLDPAAKWWSTWLSFVG